MKTLKTSGGASRKAGGFTLIELMIAIAIVGILLSLAVPAYQDYTVRAKIADALNVAASMKVLIGEYYITEAKLPAGPDEAGIKTVKKDYSDYVNGVAYTTEEKDGADPTVGILTLTFKDIGGKTEGRVLQLKAEPSNNILKWTCGTSNATGTKLDAKYLPSQCRTSNAKVDTEGGTDDNADR